MAPALAHLLEGSSWILPASMSRAGAGVSAGVWRSVSPLLGRAPVTFPQMREHWALSLAVDVMGVVRGGHPVARFKVEHRHHRLNLGAARDLVVCSVWGGHGGDDALHGEPGQDAGWAKYLVELCRIGLNQVPRQDLEAAVHREPGAV